MKRLCCIAVLLFAALTVFAQEIENPFDVSGEPAKKERKKIVLRTVYDVEGFIEHPFSVGVGVELTQYDRYLLTPAAFAVIDYDITPAFMIGVRGLMAFNFQPEDRNIAAMEATFLMRYYWLDAVTKVGGKKKPEKAKEMRWRPYFQAGLGFMYGNEPDYSQGTYKKNDMVLEAALGLRAHFLTGRFVKNWFGDMAFRYSLPNQFGVSFMIGHSFLP